MATTNKALQELDAITEPVSADLLYMLRSGAGKKITYGDLVAGIEGMVIGGGGGDSSVVDPRPIATNVLNEGAAGDDVADDTAAIQAAITTALASTTNLWNGYHVLYFPAGTYRLSNLTVTSISNLMFIGDGWASLIKRHTGADDTPMATFTGVENIYICNMAFDHNGVTSFAGFKFAAANNVTIEYTHAYDSATTLYAQGNDRYAWVFANGGPGANVSTNLIFRKNLVEDLQCEFDNIRLALIDDNDFLRGPTTAAVGTWAVDNDTVQEDITYSNNRIIDPHNMGLALLIDSVAHTGSSWKRIKVINNQIIMRFRAVTGIQVGIANTTSASPGHVWEDITVEGNLIIYEPSSVFVGDQAGILFQGSLTTGFIFDRASISNNIIEDPGVITSYGMRLRLLRNSKVVGNLVRGSYVGYLIQFHGNTQIEWNVSETTFSYADGRAYELSASEGTASVFENNFYSGGPASVLLQDGATGTDTIVSPATARPSRVLPVVATLDLPAAGNNMHGITLIEDGGAGVANLVVYKGTERFKVALAAV